MPCSRLPCRSCTKMYACLSIAFFSACQNIFSQVPLLYKALLTLRVLRSDARALVKQTSMAIQSVWGASALTTLLIHYYTNQSNSPNCCTGSFSTSATCPSSGVEFYSYFSARLSFYPESFCLWLSSRREQLPEFLCVCFWRVQRYRSLDMRLWIKCQLHPYILSVSPNYYTDAVWCHATL